MELNANAVAQLISRARLKLRDNLRGTALESIAPGSPECDRALPMLAALKDGERSILDDWLDEHLAGCETCRLRREAMEEAGSSYRAIALIVPLVWLRQATIARAADLVGADWSDVASSSRAGDPPSGSPPPESGAHRRRLGRRRRRELWLAGVICVLLALLLVGTLDQGSQTPKFVPAAAIARTHTRHPRHHPRHPARHHPKRRHAAAVTTTTTTSSLATAPGTVPPSVKHHHPASGRTTTTTTTASSRTTTSSTTVTTTTTSSSSSSTTTTQPVTTTTSSSSSTTTNPFNGQPGGPP
jgi:hypothetical protein